MANFSLYISGQTELGDVTEFFQKRLIGEGETPLAFFDGVFYESHQERVGNIVYQDYLIYSDKALYLWARGASKDYLDRFTLGSVSVNSRNKDSAFATMNLKIRREGKEPVYVIFDMVEIREAETIVKLQTVVESTIEDYLGVNFRQEIPPDTADRILHAARNICPPKMVSIPLESPGMPVPDAGIGYGQDLLEQYRTSAGYKGEQTMPPQGMPYGGARPSGAGMGAPGLPRGLEAMLPTDPASLKRIADQIRNMVGDAPFKLRDQVMRDLQHVPGDLATVLSALNELLANIAGNPHAERFVMNAIKTAVVNDGVIGSLGKIIKMTGIGSGSKRSSKPSAPEPAREDRGASKSRNAAMQDEFDADPTIRRKKISVRDDDDRSAADLFAGNDEPITSREQRAPASRSSVPDDDDFDSGSSVRRKKLSVRMEDDNEIARKLMSYDEDESGESSRGAVATPFAGEPAGESTGTRKRKLSIKAEQGSGAEADIARKLMSYDETVRGSVSSGVSLQDSEEIGLDDSAVSVEPVRKRIRIGVASEPEPEVAPESLAEPDEPEEEEEPVRKRIRIGAASEPEPEVEPESLAEPEEEELSIPEDIVFSALGEPVETPERSRDSAEYMTIESDDPVRPTVVAMKKAEEHRHVPAKVVRGKRRGK